MEFRFFILAAISFLVLGTSAEAAEQGTSSSDDLSFTAQCPQFLKEADEFGHECLQKAREQVRYWHPMLFSGLFGEGEKEVHRVYFKEAKPGSHFSLGCVIHNNSPTVGFLGVYYATDSRYFKIANESPIRYITYMDEAGFWLDKRPINLVPVRPFDTKDFPRMDLRKETGRIRNCDNPIKSDGNTTTITGFLKIVGEQPSASGNIDMNICFGEGACYKNEFIIYYPSKDRTVLQNTSDFNLITAGGDLLIRKDIYKKSCWPLERRLRDTPNIVQEVCDLNPEGH